MTINNINNNNNNNNNNINKNNINNNNNNNNNKNKGIIQVSKVKDNTPLPPNLAVLNTVKTTPASPATAEAKIVEI